MVYTQKEIETLCQVTRKALRYYEEQGLIQPKRDDRKVLYQEHDRTRIQCIQYYQHIGLQLKDMKKLMDESTTKESINDIFIQTKERLEHQCSQKQAQLQCMDRILENLRDHIDLKPNDYETLLSLTDDSMIVDTMIIPLRIGGTYVVHDIICTKKEYRFLRFLIRMCTVVIAISFIMIVIMAISGNLYE